MLKFNHNARIDRVLLSFFDAGQLLGFRCIAPPYLVGQIPNHQFVCLLIIYDPAYDISVLMYVAVHTDFIDSLLRIQSDPAAADF